MDTSHLSVTLHVVEYDDNESIPMEQRTPVRMEGEFTRDGETPIYFHSFFEPMGGVWIWETTPEGKIISSDRMRDERFRGVGDMAMSIAFRNRTATLPEDFNWTYTRKVVEVWS